MEADTGKDVSLKEQRYLDMIPPENLNLLDGCIESEKDLCEIATKLANWTTNYHYLGLEYSDVEDIEARHKDPKLQRRRALEVWKNRVGPDCTYRKILKICAEGNMHDSAMVIVKFFTESNGHQNKGKQTRRYSLQESCKGHSSRLPSHSASEPPTQRPRMESLSSGISSDAENDIPQVHSSQKRPLHSVLQESSSKRPRIDSILSGNTSDVEVDLPQVRSSQKRPPFDALESSSKHPRIDSILSGNTSDVEVDLPQGRASLRPESSSHGTIDPSLHHHSRIRSHSFGNTADMETTLPPEFMDRKIELLDAVNIVSTVTKYINLGTQLFVPSEKLNEISRYPPEEQKPRIIQGWFEHDNNPTYGTLYRALKQPSVDDTRAALQVSKLIKKNSVDSSVSADGIYHETTSTDVSGDDSILPFNQATVLNAIIKVTNDYELGLRLGLDSHTLKEIEKYPVEERKQKLVSRLFAAKPENCNWTKVNGALNEMKVGEWNDRKSVTTSGSMESTKAITTTSSLEEFNLSANEELKEVNEIYIKTKYSSLQWKIARNLSKVDIKHVKFHIETIFEPEDISELISKSDNVLGIFRLLTKNHLWNYSNTAKLSSIVREFIKDDKIKKEIDEYNGSLVGYKAGTKIWQQINLDSLQQGSDDEEDSIRIDTSGFHEEQDPSHHRMAIRKKLVVTLLQRGEKGKGLINVTDYSLNYLDEVFQDFQKKFKLSLDAVLHKVAVGSIEVTWYIPSNSAQQILNEIHETVEFLREIHASTIVLEGALIYSESTGVVNLKELNELRLLLAVQDRNVEQVDSLVEGCSKVLNEPVQAKDRTLLMTAAFGGCIDVISNLINHGANINQQDEYGWTALSYACMAAHKEAANFLIQNGADLTLTSKSSTCSNVLDLVSKYNISDMQKLLVEGLEQKMINAAEDGGLEYVKKALGMGANVDAMDKEKDEWRSLTWASHHGHLDVVKCLLSHGSDPNLKSGDNHWTPLILASRSGYYEIAQCLLDYGADVDQETSKGWTSLRFAAARGHTEVGRVLIRGNATVNCLGSEHGYTPMNQAAQDGETEFISMMIREVPDFEFDFSTEKGGWWTPLMLACKNGHVEAVRELLLAGANPNHQKQDNIAAIHVASFAGYAKVVKSLILFDADVNVADEWGVTSLMFAAKQGHLDVVKTLMEKDNLDVNAQENEAKFSAPFFAIQCKKLDILQELMNSGKVNCEVTDLKGKTLLDLVHRNSYKSAQRLFEENYLEDMKTMMSMIPQTSAAEETSVGGPLPTSKTMVERMDSSNVYITQMMKHIENRMGTGAGAA